MLKPRPSLHRGPPAIGRISIAAQAHLRRRAARIAKCLSSTYGTPDLGNKKDPLDELVYIILSQMTTGPSYARVFERLKRSLPDWGALADMPTPKLVAMIRDAGLSGQKAPRLQSIVRAIRTDFGKTSLVALRWLRDADVERYLTSLPGVGTKTAKCVMMYSLGRRVLPVDTHVKRVLTRVGLLPQGVPHERVHEAAERAVDPKSRYAIHVNAVAHGRITCRAAHPRCLQCCLRQSCAHYRARRERACYATVTC